MSGETQKDESGWSTGTLKYHVERMLLLMQAQMDRRWDDERRAVDIALRAHDEALKVAAITSEKAITAALDAQKEATGVQAVTLKQQQATQNEWRGSLNDVSTRAMPRAEAEAAITRAVEAIHEVRMIQQAMVTRSEAEAARAHESERWADLQTRLTQVEAMARGAERSRAAFLSALAGATGLIVAVIVVLNFATR